MAYDIYNENGFASAGPSINGLRVLKQQLGTLDSARFPQLASLFKFGFAPSPARLKYEVMEVTKQVSDPDVKSTLLEIGRGAARSSVIVILHSHMSIK